VEQRRQADLGKAAARWRLSPHVVTLTHVSASDQLGQYIPIVYIYIVLGPMSLRAQCSRTSRPPRAGPTNKADERADRRQRSKRKVVGGGPKTGYGQWRTKDRQSAAGVGGSLDQAAACSARIHVILGQGGTFSSH
jgi:hypothetical protein